MKKRILILVSLVCMLGSSFLTGCGSPKIRVGSFPDPEGMLMAQLIILALNEHGFDVIDAGPFESARDELDKGKIDIFPYYSGYYQALVNENQDTGNNVLMKPGPADSQLAIVITERLSEDENIKNMSDFAAYVNRNDPQKDRIKLICSPDFLSDQYALDSFERRYQFKLEQDQLVIAPSYNFAYMWEQVQRPDNDINAASAYTTGGKPRDYGLVLLQDDKYKYENDKLPPNQRQPAFHPAPYVRREIYDMYADGLNRILTPIFASLDDATLRDLNSQTGSFKGATAISEVARKYLMKNGYFKYNELQMVQLAMEEMRNAGGVVSAHPDATSDMKSFPGPGNGLYWVAGDKPGYAGNLSYPPLTWPKTTGSYTCDEKGIVTQVTTGWE
jgi:glycine betaine/choline ABC-type transport system substrate-binding protein